jgi:hypothetical protein
MDAKAEQTKKELKQEKQQDEDLKKGMEKFVDDETQKEKKRFANVINIETEGHEKFKDPDLLSNIKKELDKDHIGDDKPKLFLFGCANSCKLQPEYRISAAITGDKAEGKDNLWKTIFSHLPEKWFLDLTRTTTAAIEDDIKLFDGIYIGEGNFEGGANAPIKDTIKQLAEDGVRVLKKDARNKNKKSRFEQQPRKVVIYSTTADQRDEELVSRFCVISVRGNPSKYHLVNEHTKQVAGSVELQIEQRERNNPKKESWIKNGLKHLKGFDYIAIPYAELLEVDSRDSRSQRDLKRFLNLIRALAWICQYNRIQYEYQENKILIVDPEDFYNAMEIGKDIFDQSFTGMDPRLLEIINCMKKLIKENPDATRMDFDDAEPGLLWIDRSKIQRELDIKTRDTMIKRMVSLEEKNIVTTYYKGNRAFVAFKFSDSASNLPSNYPLITVDKYTLYALLKQHEQEILRGLLDGHSGVDSTLTAPGNKKSTNLLSLSPEPASISQKSAYISPQSAIITTLKRKIDGQKSTVDENDSDSKQKTLDQSHAMQQLHDYARTCKSKEGFLEKKAVIAFIKNALGKKDPEAYYKKLLQKGILTFYPGKGVLLTGDSTGGGDQ